MKKASDKFTIVPFEKLKNTKAWKLTSQYVRKKAKGVCYTCGKKVGHENLVAGHFREKRGGAATYFALYNLRAQCKWYCNRKRHGAKDEYARKLVNEEGAEILEDLAREGSKSKQWTKQELKQIEEHIQELLYGLKNI